jgi:glycosyltransferase involved in cell wall biosynthesis
VQRRPDVIVGTSPQFFTNCAAWMLSVFRWRPFVFELRDLWPESIKTVGAMEDSAALRLMERLELFLYHRAAVVVAVTESFRRNLIARGIDGDKIQVVTNGVDLTRFRPMERDPELAERLGLTGKLVAGYIGTHGMAHALETVLEAARRMAALPEGRDVRFVLLGDGAQKQALKATAEQMGLTNVVFLDSVPKAEVPRLLVAAGHLHYSSAQGRQLHASHPLEALRVHGHGDPGVAWCGGRIRRDRRARTRRAGVRAGERRGIVRRRAAADAGPGALPRSTQALPGGRTAL